VEVQVVEKCVLLVERCGTGKAFECLGWYWVEQGVGWVAGEVWVEWIAAEIWHLEGELGDGWGVEEGIVGEVEVEAKRWWLLLSILNVI